VIPVNPDWSEVYIALRRRGLRDKDIFNAMADQGVVAYHSALWELKTKRVTNPSFELGAALLNLYEKR